MTKNAIRFTNGSNAQLDVLARPGKSGISVFIRVRETGKRAVIGCRSVFLEKNADEAQKQFDALVADVTEKGWQRKVTGGATASQFTEVPLPTALPSSVPLAPKSDAPKAVKTSDAPKAVKTAKK